MTTQPLPPAARLKRISPSTGTEQTGYPLSTQESTVIGRLDSCQIVLDSERDNLFVSRRHVEIRPLATPAADGTPLWQVCDLDSANGTYVNENPLHGCQTLCNGDRIALGPGGPTFMFESELAGTSRPSPSETRVSLTQLFPVVGASKDFSQKAFLVPGLLTVLFVIGLIATIGNSAAFNVILGSYLAAAGYFFIYRLAGKHKPWWLPVASALSTIVLLISPVWYVIAFIFRRILPGGIETTSVQTAFIHHLFGAGMAEELLKALPIFFAIYIGRQLQSPQKRDRYGVWEPLDAILIGAASAVGFTLLETLAQYVPNVIQEVGEQAGAGTGQLVGLQLLIPRIIGSVFGHMAYSGYFGYFIGLSLLKPRQRWLLLGIGFFTSSVLHALWNTAAFLGNTLALAVVGVISYVFLLAAIVKARQISPTRSQNFATRLERY